MAAPATEVRAGGRVVLRPGERDMNGIPTSLPPSGLWILRSQNTRGVLLRTEELDARWKYLSLHDHDLFVAH